MYQSTFLLALLAFCSLVPLRAQEETRVYPFAYQDRWGLLNSEGDIIVEPTLDDIQLFWDNKQASGNGIATKNGRQGLLNGYGKWIVKPKMDSIVRTKVINFPHLHWVVRDGKFGLLTTEGKKGKWLVKPTFTTVGEDDGRKLALIPVAIGEQWGVLNSSGEMVAECEYDEVKILGSWEDYPDIKLTQNGTVTYLDAFGVPKDTEAMRQAELDYDNWDDVVFEDVDVSEDTPSPRQQSIPQPDGSTRLTYEPYLNGKYQVQEEIIVPAEYKIVHVQVEEYYYPRNIRYIQISQGDKFGFLGKDGSPNTPVVHDQISWRNFPGNKQVALLYQGDLQGLANRNGQLLLPAIFTKITGYKSMLFVDHPSGYRAYANYKGEVFLPTALGL